MADEPLVVRPAVADDRAALAEIYLASRSAAGAAMPAMAHPPDEVRRWVRGWDLRRREVWVAEVHGSPVGFASLEDAWLDSLYVVPASQRGGVGSALLATVCGCRPAGFALWVFETNAPARAFYAGHGLITLERTDGSDNEERSPDLRMAWPGADPAAYLRREVRAVEADLAVLAERRAALVRAQQRL